MSLKIIILYLSFLASLSLYAQDHLYHQFSTEDGLPSSQVYGTVQDDFGYLWVLTDKGLSRYDGYSFENFTTEDGLTSNNFYAAQKNKDGSFYLLGGNGTICKVSGANPQFTPYKFNSILQNTIGKHTPNQFLVEQSGEVYMSLLYHSGFLKLNKVGEIESDRSKALGFSHFDSQETSNEPFGFGVSTDTSNNISLLRPLSAHFEKANVTIFTNHTCNLEIHLEDKVPISIPNKDVVIGLGQLNDHSFWVSYYEHGLKIFNLKGDQIDHLFKGKSVTHLLIDREENWWVSTLSHGLFQSKNHLVKTLGNSKKGSFVRELIANKFGKLFYSSIIGNVYQIGEGISSVLLEGKKTINPITLLNDSTNLCVYSNEKIYTNDSALFQLHHSGAYKIISYPKSYGLCSFSGYYEYDLDGKVLEKILFQSVRDAVRLKDKLYLATSKGLYFKSAHDSIQKFPTDIGRINDMLLMEDVLVIGSQHQGLYFIRDDALIHKIRPGQLSGNFINSIHLDKNKAIWVSTNGGVSRISFGRILLDYNINHLTYTDGLLSNEVNDIETVRGTIYVATTKGICFFPEALMNESNAIKHNYHLRILGLEINDKEDQLSKLTHLSHSENRIAFHFKGIMLNSRSQLEYRYKLIGAETEWNYTNGLSAIYPNLDPGDYEFVLQTKGENQDWEDQQIRQKIHIALPYWKTWWFKSLIVGSILLIIYLFFRFRVLLYNRDLVREMMRQVVKRLTKKTLYFTVKEAGKEVKISSKEIKYIKSEGNYLEIHHDNGKTVIRQKIGDFLDLVPDPLEYLRIRRSYIVRIDRVEQKGKKEIVVAGETIQVGKTYVIELDKIKL